MRERETLRSLRSHANLAPEGVMAFLCSLYVADDTWRIAWSLVGCLFALSCLPHACTHIPQHPPAPSGFPQHILRRSV